VLPVGPVEPVNVPAICKVAENHVPEPSVVPPYCRICEGVLDVNAVNSRLSVIPSMYINFESPAVIPVVLIND
jgi:hypothetical protein